MIDGAQDGRAGAHDGHVGGIEVEGLVRVFKGGVRAVDGIDLSVAPGEIFGFLGPNGAGKTTTLRMLATLLSPTGGEARVAGCDLMPLLLLSGILLPMTLAPLWLRAISRLDPLSYAVDAARALFNERLADPSIPLALAILAALAVGALLTAARSFSRSAA